MEQQWKLICKKQSDLEKEKILETRSEEKLRIENLIAKAKDERRQIEQEMSDLEAQLS